MPAAFFSHAGPAVRAWRGVLALALLSVTSAGHAAVFFAAPVFYQPESIGAPQVAAGAFSGSHRTDLVVAQNGLFPGMIYMLTGKGGGALSAPVSIAAGFGPVVAVDVDKNGTLDVVTFTINLNSGVPLGNSVRVLLGKGDGSFESSIDSPNSGTFPSGVAVGDFNGDGKLDLAVANEGDFTGANANLAVLLGNGDGTFQAPVLFPAGARPSSVAAGDFRGDGKLDLAVTSLDGTLSVLLGDGRGAFHAGQTFSIAFGSLTSIAAGDLNHDGKLDLVVTDVVHGAQVFFGKGDGTFQPPVLVGTKGVNPFAVAIADLDGDGNQDLAVDNHGGFHPTDEGNLSVLLGAGDGSFPAAGMVCLPQVHEPVSVTVADIDGDGHPDLIEGDSQGRVGILFSRNASLGDANGDGQITVADAVLALRIAIQLVPGTTAQRFAADINGDGQVNILDVIQILRRAICL